MFEEFVSIFDPRNIRYHHDTIFSPSCHRWLNSHSARISICHVFVNLNYTCFSKNEHKGDHALIYTRIFEVRGRHNKTQIHP